MLPSITDDGEGAQVPCRSMTALALFLLLANGKAAIIDMASIGESSIVYYCPKRVLSMVT